MPSREAILKNLEKGRKAYSEKCEREKIEKAKKLLEQYEQKKQEITQEAEKPAEPVMEEPAEEEDESSEDEVIIERVPKNREALSKIEAQIAKMIDKIELMEARAEAKMRKHSKKKRILHRQVVKVRIATIMKPVAATLSSGSKVAVVPQLLMYIRRANPWPYLRLIRNGLILSFEGIFVELFLKVSFAILFLKKYLI